MKKYYFIIVTISIIFSCNQVDIVENGKNDNVVKKIELTSAEYISISFDNPKELTEDEAIDIVVAFTNSEIRTKSSKTLDVKVSEKIYTSHEGNAFTRSADGMQNIPSSVLLYKVTVQNDEVEDIALVCGDERCPSVIAYYSVKDTSEYSGANIANELLIEASKQVVYDNISKLEHIKNSLREATLNRLSKELQIPIEDIDIPKIKDKITLAENQETKAKITQEDNINTGTIIGRYGPWTETRWDVGMPYNRQLAQSCPNNWLWDNRYAVSSVVVAVAQALAYTKPSLTCYGVKIDWNYLKENQEIHEITDYFGSYVADPIEKRNMVANLMKYIGEQVKVSYTCSGSSVYWTDVCTFLDKHGITIDGKTNLNSTNLKNSINSLKPVIMYGQTSSGGGHWWLVDGMLVSRNMETTTSYYYMHANMGMGKSYSGYYLIDSNGGLTFDASFAHFNTNLVTYLNMRKK